MRPNCFIVVPCFNEAKRLNHQPLLELVGSQTCRLLMVNDGSSDQTEENLIQLQSRQPDAIKIHTLKANQGKGEAVRCGMHRCLEEWSKDQDIIGYFDADLSTSIEDLKTLIETIRNRSYDVVLGSRVKMLGHTIKRRERRHYTGRVFATLASLMLQLPVYDTQCGAKVFRVTSLFRHAIKDPFLSRWAFDVEILGRLLIGGPGVLPLSRARIREIPVQTWIDQPGSKLGWSSMLRAGPDLARIAFDLQRRRAALGKPLSKEV